MISISYLFEGKLSEHIKRNKQKYKVAGLIGGAGALYHSDDITPDPVKNVIRRVATGQKTIESSDELLKGYENHPRYKELKDVADQLDKKDLNRITKFGIHNKDNLPLPVGAKLPPGVSKNDIGGYHYYKMPFQNFRDREIRLRDDDPRVDVVKAFKHELGHHIDTEKNAYSKTVIDQHRPYTNMKKEYVSHKFEQDHKPGESYKDFIKKAREEAETLPEEHRSKYIKNVMANRKNSSEEQNKKIKSKIFKE